MIQLDPVQTKCRSYAKWYLRRFRHTTYTADDLVQDCWVAYLEGRAYYRRRITDAIRMWHECRRDKGRYLSPFKCSLLPALRIGYRHLEHELEQAEREKIVDDVVENLPEEERLVVKLLFWEDMTCLEIAKMTGCPEWKIILTRTSVLKRLAKVMRMRGLQPRN